ncbi:conserved phage C-terminal domain-containing protein [Brevibacillus panacihumi]|uniref:Phage conserved hypothetical protein C-terminal domain-containing protein n=1 Tax=Brevibacillus panacihumi TaxID=497735 RepID=A0A3M8C9J1_9BACL|nr:conserved phage C-terminal domain-containing protein [Brevibacillus panacihumi]RNB72153.1 hypothetical protein EDM58_21860 [Brevibacillus panacihumi]
MSIFRVRKNDNYVVMNKTALRDERLSWKAKGIIAYMLSLPDDWTFVLDELSQHAADGKDSLRAGLKELKQFGYLHRFPIKENGKIVKWETHVYETPQEVLPEEEKPQKEMPQVEKPEVEIPQMEEPLVGNPTLLSINNTKYLSLLSNNKNIVPFAEIIDYLNQKAGTSYRPTSKKTQQLITARWNEGFRLDDFKRVIDNKSAEWLKDPGWSKYLRPETLFSPKFEGYLNQKPFSKGGNLSGANPGVLAPDREELYRKAGIK